jgi:S1-C subfamily serine protease
LEKCKTLASQGDVEAAMALGTYYSSPRSGSSREAIEWFSKAADSGHPQALRKVFNAYYFGRFDGFYFGRNAPTNESKAEEYLAKAVSVGAEWAQLIVARRSEKTDPQRALDLYLAAARKDNCHAQFRLAQAYALGDLTERNLTQAYFWMLRARIRKYSDYHHLASEPSSTSLPPGGWVDDEQPCWLFKKNPELSLSPEFARLAQNAATNWRKGQREPVLPAPPASPPPAVRSAAPRAEVPRRDALPPLSAPAPPRSHQDSGSLPHQSLLTLPGWAPLPRVTALPSSDAPKDPIALFELLSRSVWLVAASQSQADLEQGRNVAVGSAVAVMRSTLLTNCHVVENRRLIWIKQAALIERARVTAGEANTDRCVLSIERDTLRPIKGIRAYDGLKVGEQVFTVGSPKGLESTLGQGIISGLRRVAGQRLVQTTAQISPGSSGGGLFDQSGNLIGITSFRVRDSQGVNFAIAAEDYFR